MSAEINRAAYDAAMAPYHEKAAEVGEWNSKQIQDELAPIIKMGKEFGKTDISQTDLSSGELRERRFDLLNLSAQLMRQERSNRAQTSKQDVNIPDLVRNVRGSLPGMDAVVRQKISSESSRRGGEETAEDELDEREIGSMLKFCTEAGLSGEPKGQLGRIVEMFTTMIRGRELGPTGLEEVRQTRAKFGEQITAKGGNLNMLNDLDSAIAVKESRKKAA